ncbi:class I SAM-dependent methyltransferase [Streptomyces sp. NPDC001941]|uniref:class I SAM-dependent methyltransferase n=1 Tax=Streptomyces sp. NPDC001941 TaxID=3154659 RepID=UPI00332885CE
MTMDDVQPGAANAAVRATYGEQDLSSAPAFAGGFINFGYWQGIPLDAPVGAEDRVRSQQGLYRRVVGEFGDVRGKTALEVGSGLGLGAALVLAEGGFGSVTGMDVHPAQLERARRANAALLSDGSGRLRFAQGAAERMPFGDAAFDCVYSVEAAQHFPDLGAFAAEAARVLRPGGRVAVTSFFLPDGAGERAVETLGGLLDSFASGLDEPHPVAALADGLGAAGLDGVRVTSIGEDVWAGLDHFLAGVEMPVTWPRNFLRAYREGLLDYYVVTAAKG